MHEYTVKGVRLSRNERSQQCVFRYRLQCKHDTTTTTITSTTTTTTDNSTDDSGDDNEKDEDDNDDDDDDDCGGNCLFVGCLTSQQQASVSQGRICSDNFTCCHTEIEVADQTFYLTQSQYTDTGPTSPSADPIMPGAWQGSHWSDNF